MQKPAAGNLRWHHNGSTVHLHLRSNRAWLRLLGPVFFLVILGTDNPWSRLFGTLLVGPGFGLNAVGLIRIVFWGLMSFWLVAEVLRLVSRETLAIGQGTVTIRRQWLQWTFYYRRFEVHAIQKVEIRELSSASTRKQSELAFDGGILRFYTATEAIAFGRTLEPAEARLALHELARLGALPAALVAPALAAGWGPV